LSVTVISLFWSVFLEDVRPPLQCLMSWNDIVSRATCPDYYYKNVLIRVQRHREYASGALCTVRIKSGSRIYWCLNTRWQ